MYLVYDSKFFIVKFNKQTIEKTLRKLRKKQNMQKQIIEQTILNNGQ